MATLLFGCYALFSMTILKSSFQESKKVPDKYQKSENPFVSNVGTESLDTSIGNFTACIFKNQTDGSLYYKTDFGRDDIPCFDKKIPDEQDHWLIINYLKSL